MISTTAIITAGGIGQRMGGSTPKQFLLLAGTPVLIHTISTFTRVSAINKIVIVVPAGHLKLTERILEEHGLQNSCKIVEGGTTRQDSVEAGLKAADQAEYIVVHDGVRPLVNQSIIEKCLDEAIKHGAAITAIPVKDTLKYVSGSSITKTIDRTGLWQAQTPQAVRRDLLEGAYKIAKQTNFQATDEASILENAGHKVAVVSGSEKNLKITQPEDLLVAETIIIQSQMENQKGRTKIGHGFDAHRLVTDRPLVLGGVTISHSMGLLGHSDADVVTHALCDALLGSIGEGDIGHHFPDSDQKYKDIASIKLLEHVVKILLSKGFSLGNADITIIAQQPKLVSHLTDMQQNLASACETDRGSINIKATTTEEMGFTGRQEGISCHAVVTVISD